MAKLIYSAITSLDGYVEDEDGSFDWAVPGEEAHAFINDLIRPIGTYLYGRRLYETMIGWETDPSLADTSAVLADFAQIWQAANKIVYSRSLSAVSTARTVLEHEFVPEMVQQMKSGSDRGLIVGGADLAGQAIRAGLVDECHTFLAPISIGSGKRSLPSDVRLKLELLDQSLFPDGMVYLRYRIRY